MSMRKDALRVVHIDERRPMEGKQVLVFRSPRAGFVTVHRIGDMWNDGVGNIAHVRAWPWWMSMTPIKRVFRSAFHHRATKGATP